jgi:hypothetical protein
MFSVFRLSFYDSFLSLHSINFGSLALQIKKKYMPPGSWDTEPTPWGSGTWASASGSTRPHTGTL